MTDYTTAEAYPVVTEQDLDLPSGAHVRVRRPSMFMMLRRGQVPAEVRAIVEKVDGEEKVTDEEMFTLLDCLVAAAFVEPKVRFKRRKGGLCIEDIPDEDRMAVVKHFGLREMV